MNHRLSKTILALNEKSKIQSTLTFAVWSSFPCLPLLSLAFPVLSCPCLYWLSVRFLVMPYLAQFFSLHSLAFSPLPLPSPSVPFPFLALPCQVPFLVFLSLSFKCLFLPYLLFSVLVMCYTLPSSFPCIPLSSLVFPVLTCTDFPSLSL